MFQCYTRFNTSWVMKKLIFGIIAVFCLQVALISNTWLNARFEPVAEQPWTYELADVDEKYPEFVATRRTEVRTVSYVPRRKPTLRPQPNTATRRPETLARTRKTPRPPVSPAAIAVRDVRKAETRPRIDKKSFFAKAWPVIKKPYSWVRTLASKLD